MQQTAPRSILGSQDLALTDRDLNQLREMIYKAGGISLSDGKRELLKSRLGKILTRRRIPSYREYIRIVREDRSGTELATLLDAITTNVTSFFREDAHFKFLEDTVIPGIVGKSNGTGKIRVWSAGCSTGEEPYSLAITLLDNLPMPWRWDVRLLATDISTKVISVAKSGVYTKDKLRAVSPTRLRQYFEPQVSAPERLQVKREVKQIVTFARLNLMDPYPFKGPFDFIFCRNVMIYFDKKVQERLVARYARYIRPGGYLFVGHSESLNGISHPYRYVRPSVYQYG